MKEVNSCVICGSSDLIRRPTTVATFIAKYVLDKTQIIECEFCVCKKCTMGFFNLRYDDDEVMRLYSAYRGDEYVRVRSQYERWYTPRLNAQIGDGPVEVKNRKKHFEQLLKKYSLANNVAKLLDYGGDRGQFIPDILRHSKKYVFDLSNKRMESGIRKIADPMLEAPYDLVMCCHVLEHVSSPDEILREILSLVDDQGIIYLEMPLGTESYEQLVQDRLKVRLFKCPRMHEHINFFTINSLQALLLRHKLEIVHLGVKRIELGWISGLILSAIVKKVKAPKKVSAGQNKLVMARLLLTWLFFRIESVFRGVMILLRAKMQ